MDLIEETLQDEVVECEVCGGEVIGTGTRCRGCVLNYVTPGTHLDDNRLDLVLPINEDDRDIGRQMLEVRGYNPDEWVEERLIVNDWESQVKGGSKITLHQTKISFLRKVKLEDTPMGEFVAWVNEKPPVQYVAQPVLDRVLSQRTLVCIGDHQAPYINPTLHTLTLEMLSDLKPDGIIYMGDGPDFDSISRHKKKMGTDFVSTVQQGVDVMHTVLAELTDAAGCADGENYYLIGNHDVRIDHILADKIPDLFGIKRANAPNEFPVMSIANLMRLGELGYKVVTDRKGDYPHGRVVLSEGNEDSPPLIASHGWIARKGAGNSARFSVEHLNASLVVGHTHRKAISHVTRWTESAEGQVPEIYVVAESGTMADGEGLGYARYPDWQPGFLTVDIMPNGDYDFSLASLRNNTLKWRGHSWSVPKGT